MPRLLAVGPRHLGPPPRARRAGRLRHLRGAGRAQAGLGGGGPDRRRARTSSRRATCRACSVFVSAGRRHHALREPLRRRRRRGARSCPRAPTTCDLAVAARRLARPRRAASWRRWRARSGPRPRLAFEAEVVGAGAQGWLRAFDADGERDARANGPTRRRPGRRPRPRSSRSTTCRARASGPRDFLTYVPMVAAHARLGGPDAATRGDGAQRRARASRAQEVDPTGAGDVFAAAFLVALPGDRRRRGGGGLRGLRRLLRGGGRRAPRRWATAPRSSGAWTLRAAADRGRGMG